jgi:hypothetical protein
MINAQALSYLPPSAVSNQYGQPSDMTQFNGQTFMCSNFTFGAQNGSITNTQTRNYIDPKVAASLGSNVHIFKTYRFN